MLLACSSARLLTNICLHRERPMSLWPAGHECAPNYEALVSPCASSAGVEGTTKCGTMFFARAIWDFCAVQEIACVNLISTKDIDGSAGNGRPSKR
jgi:hypothetical protein